MAGMAGLRMGKINVVELFAGVGGFRVGLKRASDNFEFVWANQWEPATKVQHAFDCYTHHFGKSSVHVNADIATVIDEIPEHDLLVGGFPCQDYSVARTNAQGIEGKKGVLWWSIKSIISKHHPKYILLENVDRLIKSPAKQKGRDFGIIMKSLHDEGYVAEWRVINAADYGHAQRRRRVFIFAYRKTTDYYNKLQKTNLKLADWLTNNGFFASTFPTDGVNLSKKPTNTTVTEYRDLADLSDNFSASFYNSGIMFSGRIYSTEIIPKFITDKTLEDVIESDVNERFFLNGTKEKFEYLKGSKKIERTRPNGESYVYSEGSMAFPDPMDRPARTMLTSESSINRSTHVIEDKSNGKLRTLTPIECERLNGFEDNWTSTGMPEKFRYFTMGNALVVPLIEAMGKEIMKVESK